MIDVPEACSVPTAGASGVGKGETMHGVIHRTLKQYVNDRMPAKSWDRVLEQSNIEPKLYLPVADYPAQEFLAMIETIAELTGYSESRVRRDYGQYLASELLKTYRAHIKNDWSVLDLLENLEAVFAEIEAQSDGDMPDITSDRVVSDMVILTYESSLELCEMGEGVVEGIAEEFDENVTIEQEACMLEGDEYCEFTIEER